MRRVNLKKLSAFGDRVFFPNRTKTLIFFVLIAFGVAIFRLFDLQVVRGGEYKALAVSQRSSKIQIPARRGEILVKDTATGDLVKLATNTSLYLVFIDPLVTPDKNIVANTLAPLLYDQESHDLCLQEPEYCPEGSVEYEFKEIVIDDNNKLMEKLPIFPTYEVALKKYTENIFNKINKEDIDFMVLKRAVENEKIEQIEQMSLTGIGINKKQSLVYVNPTLVPEKERKKLAKTLADILEVDNDWLLSQITGGKLRYVPLKRRLDPDVSDKILEIKRLSSETNRLDRQRIFRDKKSEEEPIPDYFRGVGLNQEHFRYYPDDSLAAQVLGFVNHERIGQYGVEGKKDQDMAGKDGIMESQNNVSGIQIGLTNEKVQDADNGVSILLTIDRIVQKKVEEVLSEAVERFKAESGQIIVLEPFTGEVIAMATYPTFNPNQFGNVYLRRRTTPSDARRISKNTPLFTKDADGNYQTAKYEDFDLAWRLQYDPEFYIYENLLGPGAYLNKNIQETYEPGSVFKPLIMAAAIDAGEVTPSTKFNEDGPIQVGQFTIRTALNKYNGWQTMTNVLETSSNIGMAFVSLKLGPAVMYRYIKDFGFGEFSFIELENEVNGTVEYYKRWSDAKLITSSFGQGLSVTTLQLANAWCSLANGGILMKPYIISEIIKNNEVLEKTSPKKVKRVISADTSSMISAMLVSSVENGVAHTARIPGYKIAGKTGTSQIARNDGIGYEDTRKEGSVITSFAGYGPVEKPRFVILVKFDRPKVGDNTWGSTTAGPAFRAVAEFLLDYYKIPPDDSI